MGHTWKPETRHKKIMAQIDFGDCWLWTGSIQQGPRGGGYALYGHRLVHRYMYEYMYGPIPDGLEIDHLCRVRRCVNPKHLEPVTRRENLLRGKTFAAENAGKTHCPQGHPYAGDNLVLFANGRHRRCRECHRQAQHRYWLRQKGLVG